jgi:hypothetical protein
MGRRGVDWLLIVVLTGVWAGLFVRGIGEGLRTQRGFIDVRVSSARAGDYPIVQDGPASDPAFEPRDRVIAVDGKDLRDARQLDSCDLATRGARELEVAAGHSIGGLDLGRFRQLQRRDARPALHRLACEASDLFAAAAPFNSPGPMVACAPPNAVPILITHSRTDTWVPYDGGHLYGCPECTVPPVRDQFEAWRNRDSCTGSSPDVTEHPGETSVCELYTNCADGAQVGLCSVDSAYEHPTCIDTFPPPWDHLPCSLWDGHVSYWPYVLDGFNTQQRVWDFLSSFPPPPAPPVPVFPYGPSASKLPRGER